MSHFGKYNQISVTDSAAAARRAGRPRCTHDVLEAVGALIGLTAIVVYGNFWYDFVPYVCGSDYMRNEDQARVLLVSACICVTLGVIAFILEREACGCGMFSSSSSSPINSV